MSTKQSSAGVTTACVRSTRSASGRSRADRRAREVATICQACAARNGAQLLALGGNGGRRRRRCPPAHFTSRSSGESYGFVCVFRRYELHFLSSAAAALG